jgi:hypothetical protein
MLECAAAVCADCFIGMQMIGRANADASARPAEWGGGPSKAQAAISPARMPLFSLHCNSHLHFNTPYGRTSMKCPACGGRRPLW